MQLSASPAEFNSGLLQGKVDVMSIPLVETCLSGYFYKLSERLAFEHFRHQSMILLFINFISSFSMNEAD